jgi:hydroxymethylglutaryl-CoA lyase
VLLQDVTARDGLQNLERVYSPKERAELIDALAEAGLPRIQIGSFVNPRRVPQMAGAAETFRLIRKRPGVRYDALVLNLKGIARAADAGLSHVEIFVSATQTHSLKNSGMTVEEALNQARSMATLAHETGMSVTAGVMCAFGCHYEGAVPIETVARVVQELERLCPQEITLADTTGMGTPEGVERILDAVSRITPIERIALHLHDTFGRGLANMEKALALGVRRFDAALGGLGGCPFIPGAKGNIRLEDAIRTAHHAGFPTEIDLGAVEALAARWKHRILGIDGASREC